MTISRNGLKFLTARVMLYSLTFVVAINTVTAIMNSDIPNVSAIPDKFPHHHSGEVFNTIRDKKETNRDIEDSPLTELEFFDAKFLDVILPEQMLYQLEENPLLEAGLFEGDISGVKRWDFLLKRQAIIDSTRLWPNQTVAYVISSEFTLGERKAIARAITDYFTYTCINLLPRDDEADYINITKGFGCSSAVGRQGGQQLLSLGTNCFVNGIVIHELMHSLGIWHEQSRPDRDDFVTINFTNIIKGREQNFIKFTATQVQQLGEEYDYGSVMHYGPFDFAADRSQRTIIPADPVRGAIIGQRRGFSTVDIRKINKLYGCPNIATAGSVRPYAASSEHFVSPSGQCIDSYPKCEKWAKMGFCQKNSAWMNVNCLQSCGICVNMRTVCRDMNNKCSRWAIEDHCHHSPGFMFSFCRHSCGRCNK